MRIRSSVRTARRAALAMVLFVLPALSSASGAKPSIHGSPTQTATVGRAYEFTPTLRDREGDRLFVGVYNKPQWLKLERSTGRLFGTPTVATRHAWMAYEVWDGSNYTISPWFSIDVRPSVLNQPPTLIGSPQRSVVTGQTYFFWPRATDLNGDRLTFSIANKPAWATFSVTSGYLLGIPKAAGFYGNIVISVSDGRVTRALPAFSIDVSEVNYAPVISGSPPPTAIAGSGYTFRPHVSDRNGDPLRFSVANAPSWAAFDPLTGTLTGTPAPSEIGTYSNVSIRVTDGRAAAALPPFSIVVSEIASGSATLIWMPPTNKTDGSPLTGLSGYRIYYGTHAQALTRTIELPHPGVASYVVDDLPPGKYYFALSAYTNGGTESALSNVMSKTIL